MRIGILGSGLIGGKLGTLFARAGHDVTFSYARSRDKLDRLANDAGANARAGTPQEAVEVAEVLLLAVHWSRMDDVLRQVGDLSGKTVITCSLPMTDDDTALAVGHTTSGAEILAARIPKAHVISAFSTTPSEVLFGVFDARGNKPSPTLALCGDDAGAKRTVAGLISEIGFDPLDVGGLQSARHLEPFSLLIAGVAYDGQGGPEVSYRIHRR